MRAESLRDMLCLARPLSSRLKAEEALSEALSDHRLCDPPQGTTRCACGLTEAAAAFWATVTAYSGCSMTGVVWQRMTESFVSLVDAYDTYEGTETIESAAHGLYVAARDGGLLSAWNH